MQLTAQDETLIYNHFAFAELSRSYSPSGIYLKVQAFIEDGGLDDARLKHGEPCELFNGWRTCRCQDRRGYTFEDQEDGSVLIRPNQ